MKRKRENTAWYFGTWWNEITRIKIFGESGKSGIIILVETWVDKRNGEAGDGEE